MFYLKNWDDLPQALQNKQVKKYYDILKGKFINIFLKRVFDIIVSFVLLVILSPVILIVFLAVKLTSNGSAFYLQERVTIYGKRFKIIKFRTMIENADKIGTLVTTENDKRVTPIGQKLRKYRLDEILQLINILKGDMSFVGTRPEVLKYVLSYEDYMMATLLMPAGVTSLASINFKDEDKLLKSSEDADKTYIEGVLPLKMKYNLEYIEKFNLFYDIKIMLKTVLAVFK